MRLQPFQVYLQQLSAALKADNPAKRTDCPALLHWRNRHGD